MTFNNVHRIRPDGRAELTMPNFDYSNGLAFSRDERLLYVATTGPGHGGADAAAGRQASS
jgi:sugar lactone lactonase YvrE